ncbi:hypothetical protein [Polycyclovorans algicola]|uniref:hypothetical protein n=1 Tax=Polycyclovorans algicola TaxID=616992 RepID=UPI0004A74754|nr:hypothetical protein [Polycyclovorans algicola]
MKHAIGISGALVGLAASFAAQAQTALDIHGRLGASGGLYSNEFTVSGVDQNGAPVDASAERDELVYGLLGGIIAVIDGYYANTELEVQQIDDDEGADFKSTDITLTFGKQFANGWGPFLGYRHVRQGDGVFDDDVQRENGYFAGLNYSGLPIGQSIIASFGAAYVISNVDVDGLKFDDADGVSLRATANIADTPHSFSLRYRQFSGDVGINDPSVGSLDVEIEESYFTLSYQYTLPITSLPISSGF